MNRKMMLAIALTLVLASCYNQRKAVQQVARATAAYPDTTAAMLRARWPCITTQFDSSAYVAGREALKARLLSIDSLNALVTAYQTDAESLEQALNRLSLDSATKQTCRQLIEYADKKEKENIRLTGALNKISAAYAEMARATSDLPPIIKFVEDSSKVYAANRETQAVRLELAKTEAKRDMWKKIALILGSLLIVSALFIFVLLKRKK